MPEKKREIAQGSEVKTHAEASKLSQQNVVSSTAPHDSIEVPQLESSTNESRTLGDVDTQQETFDYVSGSIDEMPKPENQKNPTADQENGNSAPKKEYVACFKNDKLASNRIVLVDERPEGKDPKPDVLDVGEGDINDFSTSIAHYLIGYVAGKFPGRKIITQCVQSWEVSCGLTLHPSGWQVMKFQSIEDRDRVLEQGPYFIDGRQFVLHVMPELFNFREEDILQVPLWVRFPNLPLQLWNKAALSKIASKFGKPLYTDTMTSTKERLSYARVLIIADVSKDQKQSITLNLPNGYSFEQFAVYEYWPKVCTKCKAIGHEATKCRITNKSTTEPAAGPDLVHNRQLVTNTSSETNAAQENSDGAKAQQKVTGLGASNTKSSM